MSKLILALPLLLACQQDRPAPAPVHVAPAAPQSDAEFVTRALGPGHQPATPVQRMELDGREGQEALVAGHRQGVYQVAVADQFGKALARAPLTGGLLAHSTIQSVQAPRLVSVWADSRALLLPLRASVTTRAAHSRETCGFLLLRYRNRTLALAGEFATRCATGDPYKLLQVEASKGQITIRAHEEKQGPRGQVKGWHTYRWDETRQAFVSAPGKSDSKPK